MRSDALTAARPRAWVQILDCTGDTGSSCPLFAFCPIFCDTSSSGTRFLWSGCSLLPGLLTDPDAAARPQGAWGQYRCAQVRKGGRRGLCQPWRVATAGGV